jgi:hypothetical protein
VYVFVSQFGKNLARLRPGNVIYNEVAAAAATSAPSFRAPAANTSSGAGNISLAASLSIVHLNYRLQMYQALFLLLFSVRQKLVPIALCSVTSSF